MKFWNWIRNEKGKSRVLRLDGPIDDEQWWGDEVTPDAFREELEADSGDITVWINSQGGNVFAAAQIYNMLKAYKGKVTVKIDALAASAATVIAMAGDEVLMSPVAIFMIHRPMTIAMGNQGDFEEAIRTLNAVQASIVNAYTDKTGKTEKEINKLMVGEGGEGTWMDSKQALALGFIDRILTDKDKDDDDDDKPNLPFEPEPDDPNKEEEKEDKNGTTARIAEAKRQYAAYLGTIKAGYRNELAGSAEGDDAGADEADAPAEADAEGDVSVTSDDEGNVTVTVEVDVKIKDEDKEEDEDDKPDESSEPSETETESEPSEDDDPDEEEKEDKVEDKVYVPAPVFDENGLTEDGSASYNILVDKLNALR